MSHDWERELRGVSLRRLLQRFGDLSTPPIDAVEGEWRASFVGPAWLRTSTPRTLGTAGFSGWWGKRLLRDASINLFGPDGTRRSFPMTLSRATSIFDGGECLALVYPEHERWPWPHVRDELRALDDDHLLGETKFELPGLRRLPFPFLLTRVRPA